MSQYPPSPYAMPYAYPAGYGYDPMHAYLAPAKRAALLMFIVGGLGIACGVCMGLVAMFAPIATMLKQSGLNFEQFGEIGMSPESFLRMIYIIGSVGSLFVSLILLLLAIFVRRGSMVATISAIVVCSMITLFTLLNVITGIYQLITHPSGSGVIGLLFVLVLFGAFGLMIAQLILAIRSISVMRKAQAQYQAQFMQYQQQQQMYAQQSGYGYAQVPQPPPSNPAGGTSDGTATQG